MVTISVQDPRIVSQIDNWTLNQKMSQFFRDEFDVSDEMLLYQTDIEWAPKEVQKDFFEAKKLSDNEYTDY